MIGAIGSFFVWLLGLFFKPASRDAEIKKSGATEVQKDEAENVLKKVIQADRIRDVVRGNPVGGLRDDEGNLYRD